MESPSPINPRPTYLPFTEKTYLQKLNPIGKSSYGLKRGEFQLGQ